MSGASRRRRIPSSGWSAWASRSWSRAAPARAPPFPTPPMSAAGAKIAGDAAAALGAGDIVLKVQRPLRRARARSTKSALMKRGAVLDRHAVAAAAARRRRGLCQGRAHRLRDGADAAHHPRAVDGRAVVAGEPRRLSRGARRRERVRPRLADDDDRRRHHRAGARPRHGRRRRRACRRSPRRAVSAPSSRRPMCGSPPRSRSRASAPPSSPSIIEAMKATETAGGYAKEMGEDFARRQREHVTEALKKIDIVICTALIPGRKAPVLITRGDGGGDAAGLGHRRSRRRAGRQCRGQRVRQDGDDGERRHHRRPRSTCRRASPSMPASSMPRTCWPSSACIIDKDKQLKIDTADEIVKATLLTRDGAVVHPQLTAAAPAAGA